jgi:hypothetical protein
VQIVETGRTFDKKVNENLKHKRKEKSGGDITDLRKSYAFYNLEKKKNGT